MEQFVHRTNLERLRMLLQSVTDERFRDQIKQLIAEDEARAVPVGKGDPKA